MNRPYESSDSARTRSCKRCYYQMKIYLCTLALLSVLPSYYTCSAQATDSTKIVNSLNKCWRATSHEYSTIYGLDEDEIKSYAKQKVCFTRDSVTMYYGALYGPKYSIKKVNAENFAKDNFDCSKEKLGMVEDSVFEITISSVSKASRNETAHKMTDVIAFDGYFVYIVKDGVIFKLFDADAKVGGRSSN
jgi:hypothetical protein